MERPPGSELQKQTLWLFGVLGRAMRNRSLVTHHVEEVSDFKMAADVLHGVRHHRLVLVLDVDHHVQFAPFHVPHERVHRCVRRTVRLQKRAASMNRDQLAVESFLEVPRQFMKRELRARKQGNGASPVEMI